MDKVGGMLFRFFAWIVTLFLARLQNRGRRPGGKKGQTTNPTNPHFPLPPRRPFGYTIPMFSFFCPPFRQFHFDEIAILVGVLEEGPFAALLLIRRIRNPWDLPAKQPRHHRYDVELRLPRRFAFQRLEGIRGHRLCPHLLPSREVGCKRRAPQTGFHRLMNFELFFAASEAALNHFLPFALKSS